MSALVTKRTKALAALMVAVLSLSALPSIVSDGDAVPSVSAAADLNVEVGWMSEIVNWNPMYIAMVEDWVATFLMYSALWQYDEDWANPVPDLALSYNYTYHPDGTMTMWVNLTHDAYFRNIDTGTDDTSMPLTAYDVTYTFWVACSKQSTAWEYYMKDYIPSVVDDYTVRLDIPFIKATAIDDITGIPIVPDGFYNWSGIALQDAMYPDECLGSGPFTFDGYVEASWYRFRAAPNYHGAADFPDERTLTIDTITYSLASEASGLAADMNSGALDVAVMSGEPDIYLNTLAPDGTNKMVREAVQELGICDIAINAVPLEFRVDSKSAAADYCDGNLHLLDPAVREALVMTLNKAYIEWAIMKNLSTMADSVIPPGDWHHDVDDLAFDTTGARQVLLDAGYVDDGGDFLVAGPTSYFMQNGFDQAPYSKNPRLEGLRCQAPNTDPSYTLIATSWLGFAADAGIGFDPEYTGEAQESYMINSAWYKCLYDIWVWHWGWGPEPLSDLSVWQTYEIDNGGDNCQMPMGEWYVHGDMDTDGDGTTDVPQNYTTSPYVDASMITEFDMAEDGFRGFSSFDQNFSEAMHTPDVNDRRDIVYSLQDMVYDSYCETPPYYDLGLYAYSEARYQGWGDWSEHSGRTVISGMPWVWFDLIPAGNMIPSIDVGLQSSYDLDIDELGTFSITVSDVEGDQLWVNYTFGDGSDPVEFMPTPTTDPIDVSTSHSYSATGTYTVTVTVTDGYTGHTVTDTASVVVSLPATAKPVIGALSYDPITDCYVGEETTWTFTVTDTDSADIRATVAWGDGTYFVDDLSATPGTAIPVEALHTYLAAATYTVTIYASDGTNNESVSRTYTVIANSPPTAPVVSDISGLEGNSMPISATTSDVDPDTLIITWEWDDGTFDVTGPFDTSSDPGAVVTSSVTHTWDTAGSYDFTVWVDDQEGHNVSTTATATISPIITPVAPSVTSMVQTPNPGTVDELVTLTIGAYDSNGDALDFYVEFGDGEAATDSTAAATGEQTVVMTHTYTAAGDYTMTVHINDGTFNVSADCTVRIVAPIVNSAPTAPVVSDVSAFEGESRPISATTSDVDPDTLIITWEWDDGTFDVTGPFDTSSDPGAVVTSSVTHTWDTAGSYDFTVWVDDQEGHNVSTTATATISPVDDPVEPSVTSMVQTPNPGTVDELVTLTIGAYDSNGDALDFYVEFGDGEAATDSTAAATGEQTVVMTHTYTAAGDYTMTVYINDGTFNVSADYTVQIVAPTVNSAPMAPAVFDVSAYEDESRPISATTSDVDPDTLIITWEWDDGTFDVTGPFDTSSDPGAVVTSSVTHTWDTVGSYDFTVWVDDQEGHNVSTTATATILPRITPVEPSVTSMVQTPNPGTVDELVTLTIGAYDSNGDALDFYVEFGDGEAATDSTAAATGEQTIVMTHTYTAAGDYTMTVYINDGTFNVSADYTVRIVAPVVNSAPEIVLMSAYSAMYNETFEITPTQVFDADGDEVSVWYEWGDDTESAGDAEADYVGTHEYSVTGNVTLTAYADDNTGEPGHNVSTTATVTVSANRRPETKLLTVSPEAAPTMWGAR